MANSRPLGVRYRIEEPPIGQGGMGVVYRAFDNVTKRFVALKTVRGSIDPASLDLFQKEWTVLAHLCHPNIVDILDIGELTENSQSKPYFVMPLLPGQTLDYLIKNAGQRLTPERTLEIIGQACRGLQAAHDQGLVHRDVKPSNLFVMDDDTVKIIDFGVVHLSEHESRAGVKGTLHYMAPEQLEMKPATLRSDIFSLGVVCYEALTGRKPFDRKTGEEVAEAIRSHIPPPICELNPAINEQVSRTVFRAMAKQPYHRFASAREFSDCLQKSFRNERVEIFDKARIQPRLNRIKKALNEADYQFAMDILCELESEGNIDPEMSLLRIQVEQAMRAKTIHQLLEGARTRMEEEEYPLALQKIQNVLDLDPANIDALALQTSVERQRSIHQVEKWHQIARQHLDNRLFTKARQAVDEVLKIDPEHEPAREILTEITKGEQDITRLRQEKQHLYDSALKAYRNGEISSALTRLERVIEIGKKVPGHPNSDAQYLAFYDQIRSERDELQNAYAEGKKALKARKFDRALELCREVLRRRPGDPLFKSLKIEIEDSQRQESSASIADLHSRIEAEADLERKFSILKDAVKLFPGEQTFQHSLKLVKERRDLVNSIVTRARHYESQGQFLEANNQWDVLRSIYGQYPGLDFEMQRLNRRQEEFVREEAKASWVERIDRALGDGDHEVADELIKAALEEAPQDEELVRLKDQAQQVAQRCARAQELLHDGEQLAGEGSHLPAILKLREARELDDRAREIVTALSSVLVEYARKLAQRDWRSAVPFVEEAAELNPDHPSVTSVSLLIEDVRRREVIESCLVEARELQTAGSLHNALGKVEQVLREYPNEIRLVKLLKTLQSAIEHQHAEAQSRLASVASERAFSAAASRGNGISSTPRLENRPSPNALDKSGHITTGHGTNRQSSNVRGESRVSVANLLSGSQPSRESSFPKRSLNWAEQESAFKETQVSHSVECSTPPPSQSDDSQWTPPDLPAFRSRTRQESERPSRRPLFLRGAIAAAVVLSVGGAVLFSGKFGTTMKPAAADAVNTGQSGHPPSATAIRGAEPNRQTTPQVQPPVESHKWSGFVQFRSNPSPALIELDGDKELTCQTPCYLPLPAGRHTLVASAANYETGQRIIQVPEVKDFFIPLNQNRFRVLLSSEPAGGAILIDGEARGVTPTTLYLGAGDHKLRVVKDDWTYDGTINVVGHELQSIQVHPVKNPKPAAAAKQP